MKPWAAVLVTGVACHGCSVLLLNEDYTSGRAATDGGTEAAAPPSDPYADVVLADAPVSYWRVDDAPGARLHDEMNRHDLVIAKPTGATFGVPGVVGKAVALTADSDLVTDGELDLRGSFTIEAWVRHLGKSNDYDAVFFSGDPRAESHRAGSIVWINPTRTEGLGFERWADGAAILGTPGPGRLVTTRFTHVVAAYGEHLELYVDGVLSSADRSGVVFGGEPGGPTHWGTHFVGDLDELAFYEKRLTPERILAHFDAGRRWTAPPK